MMYLDRPMDIGSLALKNRLVIPPMQTGKTMENHVTAEMIEYYKATSFGSAPGLFITEHCFISKEGQASPTQLSIADDGMIEEHRQLVYAIKDGGAAAFIQINHGGANGVNVKLSASDLNVPSKAGQPAPRPLEKAEIAAIEDDFAKAAVRAVKAGYDGVEIHCAHGYLLNQFYSPLTNKRTDEYGGCLENRLRFLLETVAKVREAVGKDFPLAVRLGGSDYMDGGNTEEDAVRACVLLEKAGVDLIDISGGMCFYNRQGHTEPGYFSSMTEKIRAEVKVPVVLTGGVNTLEDAEALLKDGKADLIGVGRAVLADPCWGKR